jgi:hypothetical protein
MAKGIDLDGAGVDMWPDETTKVVEAIGAAATDFRAAWLGKLGEIAALDSQLGQGPLGRTFAKDYIPAVKQIVDGLDELGRRVEDRVRFGNYAVNEYILNEQNNAQRFQT